MLGYVSNLRISRDIKYTSLFITTYMPEKFLEDYFGNARENRRGGSTMVIDRFAAVPWEIIPDLSQYITYVKIGWTLSTLLTEKTLSERIRQYRNSGLSVSHGGTLLEMAVHKGRVPEILSRLKTAGYNSIEISEGVMDIPDRIKQTIAEYAHSNGMHLNVEVGKKNPRNQLSLDETITKIGESMDLEPEFIIVEGRESGRSVEIFDDLGEIKWDWVNRIMEESPKDKIMFEAPQEKQQIELVIRLGSGVNLGNVSINSVAALETQRRGMRGDTFGILDTTVKVTGPPSNKFVYYMVANHGPIDQAKIMELTGINRKTLQTSLAELLESGLIRVSTDRKDLRKRVYSLNTGLQ